jgi:hypothetical protein
MILLFVGCLCVDRKTSREEDGFEDEISSTVLSAMLRIVLSA